jgi:hypothetical protein
MTYKYQKLSQNVFPYLRLENETDLRPYSNRQYVICDGMGMFILDHEIRQTFWYDTPTKAWKAVWESIQAEMLRKMSQC